MEQTNLWLATLIVILLLVINTVIAVVVFIVGLLRKPGDRCTTCLRGVFFLVCPVVGVLAFLVSSLLMFLMRSKRFDRESLTFSVDSATTILPPDENTELNYIPIMDALEGSDTAELRQLLLNVIKNKSILNVHSLTNAVSSRDAETSHYAASALANFRSEFRAAAREQMMKVEQMPGDVSTILQAISFFQTFIKADIMDAVEQKSYIYIYEDLNEKLYARNRWFLAAQHYLDVVDDLISVGDYAAAAKWIARAEECRPNELETFKAQLHLYFSTHRQDKLLETLDRIKRSDVLVDREVLNLIRIMNERD